MKNLRKKGKVGEELAISFLVQKDFSIIETNYTIRGAGEIDIIAKKNSHISFVEVKLSENTSFGDPIYKINKTKTKRIYNTANIYLSKYVGDYNSTSFDVITIVKNKNNYNINHIENAFWGNNDY